MSKYNNRKVIVDGIEFDSLAESYRYQELKMSEAAGEIYDLKIHQRWELQPAFKHGGKMVRAIYYEDDFNYIDRTDKKRHVEDVKGLETEVFKIKHKMFLNRYPDVVFEIVKVGR
ncbi:MAG: DUF1064 domain-containing protein [Chloroflexi bacterium]|nr:DUF1064 domain-containing protein [Chloroflexota bacterium]